VRVEYESRVWECESVRVKCESVRVECESSSEYTLLIMPLLIAPVH
jgi:hypothetical protein